MHARNTLTDRCPGALPVFGPLVFVVLNARPFDGVFIIQLRATSQAVCLSFTSDDLVFLGPKRPQSESWFNK